VQARTAQLRATQNELVHAGKMAALGQMSAGMAHELNQPLTAMRTLSDSAAILLDQGRQDEVRGNLRRIAAMVDRLARITSQLKTFAHKQDAPSVPVPLARSIADAQAVLVADAAREPIVFEVDVQPPTLAVLADEALMGSVLVNLMKNAAEAMRDMPRRVLRIQARLDGDRAIISLCDTGPGIRADILPRLFQPFVTSKLAGAGLGLGLVISTQMVRAVGGTLRAFNREDSEGGGACFVIDLPAASIQE
jgi:two-component system C4-dicarboxylate transport sensor histidine kinase DctB